MKRYYRLRNRIREYIFNPSINIKERAFVVFSAAVLVALFAAIPCGLIMNEPRSATVATFAGAMFFLIYVIISFKRKRIARARVVISFILIFLFLPAMLFTNGGVYSGAPIWLLLGTIYIALTLDGKFRVIMLVCDFAVITACWVVGYYFPELITEYSKGGNYFDSLAALTIVSVIVYWMISFQSSILSKDEEHKNIERLFDQTAIALVDAIDAKDEYTRGHSRRVAQYSKKIAEFAGKSYTECEEIYYVALLHDVGKIGIPENIINKQGRLTEEEYEIIKAHSEIGAQILQNISEFPYISIGAHFHHERYDGKGYPLGLKGDDIPEIARIIAVADAYDAMTSKRSYRKPFPQTKVREELLQGSGTQFDPEFAGIMIHLIDIDTDYKMSEMDSSNENSDLGVLIVDKYRDNVSDGILLSPNMTTLKIKVDMDDSKTGVALGPGIVMFDSLDTRFHDNEKEINKFQYFEYIEIRFDGEYVNTGALKTEVKSTGGGDYSLDYGWYRIEAVRIKDHALIRIICRDNTIEAIIALPDSSRFAYIGLTGEGCRISGMSVEKSQEKKTPDYIPRISEEISYIDVPAGDIPNVQIDGYRTDATQGILIEDGMSITFHTKSLPTARLVWHCPSYVIYSSDDGTLNGENYKEYSYVRLDGENWEAEEVAKNEMIIDRDNFEGWDSWMEYNKDGYECTIVFNKAQNRVISYTDNCGINIKVITEIVFKSEQIYVALSGDQCALTNIRINKI